MANLFRDQFRRITPDTGLESDQLPASDDPEQTTDRNQLVRRTREAVSRLGEDQRQVLTLIDLAGHYPLPNLVDLMANQMAQGMGGAHAPAGAGMAPPPPPGAAPAFHVARDGQTFGPFNPMQLQQQVSAGTPSQVSLLQ